MKEYILDNPGIPIGLLLIAAGIVAGRWPQLTGLFYYHTPEKRKNVDMRGAGLHLMTGFIILGVIITVLDLAIRTDETQFFIRMPVIVIGLLIVLGTAQRYDHNK